MVIRWKEFNTIILYTEIIRRSINLDKELKNYMDKVKNYYSEDSRLSTQEVARILLGKSNDEGNSFESSDFVNFDMNEFSKWKELNNEKYMVKINNCQSMLICK